MNKHLIFFLQTVFWGFVIGIGADVIGFLAISFTFWEWIYDWILLRGAAVGLLLLTILFSYLIQGSIDEDKKNKEKENV